MFRWFEHRYNWEVLKKSQKWKSTNRQNLSKGIAQGVSRVSWNDKSGVPIVCELNGEGCSAACLPNSTFTTKKVILSLSSRYHLIKPGNWFCWSCHRSYCWELKEKLGQWWPLICPYICKPKSLSQSITFSRVKNELSILHSILLPGLGNNVQGGKVHASTLYCFLSSYQLYNQSIFPSHFV